MNKRTKLAERKLPNYTRGEEIFNMVTHIVGAAFGVAMLVLGIVFAAVRGHVVGILAAIVFGLSLIVLYTMSAVYHGLSPRMKGKKVMQILDHCSVFLLIAGSYTPLTICTLVPANIFDDLLSGARLVYCGVFSCSSVGFAGNCNLATTTWRDCLYTRCNLVWSGLQNKIYALDFSYLLCAGQYFTSDNDSHLRFIGYRDQRFWRYGPYNRLQLGWR